MFNWYSAPTFAVMLFFVLLAAYVLTRSPRTPATIAAVGAQIAVAAYLFGQGMQANATTVATWLPWARNLQWGAAVAPALWYWLTALLVGEQPLPAAQQHLRRFGYPLGAVLAAGALFAVGAMYLGDSLYRWGAPQAVPAVPTTYYRFRVDAGPWYPAFGSYLLLATFGAGLNLWRGGRLPLERDRQRRFRWLLLSAALFVLGVGLLAATQWLMLAFPLLWLGHIALAVAMAFMASNVAAYRLLINVDVIRGDLLYFSAVLGVAAVLGALIFLAAGPPFSIRLLELFWYLLFAFILGLALVDTGRRLLDRFFFKPDVRLLRSNLASAVRDAPLASDFDTLLSETQIEIAEVSEAHMLRLTEEALRRINRPSALAQCGLIERLPRSLAAGSVRPAGTPAANLTPLEQAAILRAILAAGIERLKPSDRSAGAAQYVILREEYLLDLPNKQIMGRHGISESTFHRQRREAIAILAQDLGKQEQRLAGTVAPRL